MLEKKVLVKYNLNFKHFLKLNLNAIYITNYLQVENTVTKYAENVTSKITGEFVKFFPSKIY